MKTCWVTKKSTLESDISYPPFRIDPDEYTMVLQKESMSGLYPGASWLMETKLLDYSGSIIIPFISNKPCAGFVFHDTKHEVCNYLKKNHDDFKKLKNKFPEWFI